MNNALTTTQQANIVPLAEIKQAAEMVAKSGLFGVKSTEEAATLMMVAQAEGSHIMTAMRDFHVIDGKPTLKADAIIARFQKAGGSVKWIERSDTACEAVFSHPQGGELSVRWTYEMAEKAEFTFSYKKEWKESKTGKKYSDYVLDKNGNRIKEPKSNWQRMPRQMLAARTISEGVRAIYAPCLNGFYTPEEMQDIVDADVPVMGEPRENTAGAPIKKAIDVEVVSETKAKSSTPNVTAGASAPAVATDSADDTPPDADLFKINIDGIGKPAQKATLIAAAGPATGKLTQNGQATLYQFLNQPKVWPVAEPIVKRFCDPKKVYYIDKSDIWAILCEVTTKVKDCWIPKELNDEFVEVQHD